jgi:hypothetical protein
LRKRLQTPEGRAELTNETMSSMADIFSSTIDALRENPSLADELIQKDPGFFRKIWEWVKERLNKIGFDFNTLSAEEQKALGKLPKLLYKTTDGEVEVEASVNERIAGANTLIALWDRAQAGTEVALSSRQRQARIFAKRTLATIEATKKTEAKVKEAIDAEDAEAAAKRKEAEEKEQARVAKKREAEITKVVNKIKQISETEESWYWVEAAGTATTIEDRNTAVQMLPFGLKDATPKETDRLGQALAARYDKYAAKAKAAAEREAKQKQKEADQKTRAAEELAARQAEAQRRREAAALAKKQQEEAAKTKQTEREVEQERKALQRQREKEQAAEERRRNAEQRRNAAAERLAAKQVEKERKEAERQQRKADAAAAKLAEQQRREREAAEAAEAAAQAAAQQEQEEKEARTRRKGERIPKLRRGYIAPGQLRVGDIVSYNYWKAKVIEATGSGLEQRVKLQRLSDAEAKMIDTMDRQDWWNAVPFAGRVFTVNMTSSKIISLVASRSEEEVLKEEGVKMLRERLRADLERREGDPPRFSIVGQYDDMAVDMRYSKALGLMEAFKAGGEIPSTSTWDAIHDYKSRGFNRDEWNQAIKYFEEYGMWPYLSAGQYTIPVQIDTQVEPLFSINLGKKEQAIHEPTGLPLNKNGTVTVYYPTTNDNARRLIETRELVGHSVDAKRIYLTNESSGAAIAKKPGTIEQPTDGANVLLHIDPNLLSLDAEYEGGRKDFYITIREGEAFDQKMKQVKLFTLDIDRDKPVSPPLTLDKLNEAVADAVAAYRALKPEQRKERLREAKKRLKAKHNVGVLLSQPNAKLRKTSDEMGPRTKNGKRVSSLGLGLASAQKLGDKLNLCANSANCRDTCLGDKSGLNALYGGEGSSRSGPRLSQYLKTEALVLSTEDFAVALYAEIEKFERAVLRERRQPSVRLNQTSDLPPSVLKPFIEAFPRTIFYDYTKLHSSSIAPNHHLTYSSTGWSQMIDGEYQESKGTNWGRMRNMLDSGFNVAISFTGRGKTSLPDFILDEQTGVKYTVIDGDTYDARFLDQQPEGQPGIVIGLRNKDDTRAAGKEPLLEELKAKGRSLFVYYDRQVHGPTLGVPPQKASEETIARLKERMKAAPPAQAEAELEGEQETPSFSVLGRVTPEMDAEYMAAAKSGDLATAQRMVDEAGKATGYTTKAYHGSDDAEITAFNEQKTSYGYYFAPDPLTAEYYAKKEGKVYGVLLNLGNTLDLTDEGERAAAFNDVFGGNASRDQAKVQEFAATLYKQGYNQNESVKAFFDGLQDISYVLTGESSIEEILNDNYVDQTEIDPLVASLNSERITRAYNQLAPEIDENVFAVEEAYGSQDFYLNYQTDVMQWAEANGYNSVVFDDPSSTGEPLSYVVFNSNQIKSADPITYDDNGNIIPLSQRFQDTTDDIRFSAKGKGGKGKKGKPKRVSGKAAREAVKASRSAAAQLAAAQERVRKERAKELPGIKVAAELAYKGGEGTDIGEAPGTAIASDTEEGRALIRALREQARTIDTQVLPDLTADDDARSKAVAELANNYEGVKAALYKEIDNTGAVSEPWKVYATMLIAAQEAEKAMSGRMTVAKYMAAYEAEQRDSIVKRAASASLRVRKDAVMSAAARNRAHIFAGTKAMRKEVNKLRKAAEGGNKEKREKAERKIAKMRAAHAKAVVEAIDGMSEEGYDVDGLFSYLSGGDPVTFSRIVKRLADARTLSDMREGYASTYWDAVMEARMASLLSGPATHTANIVGNAAMVTLRTTRQLAEVLTNTVIRDPDSADFGDFKAYMTGFLRSLGRAGRNLMMAYRTDMPVFEVQLSRDTALEFAEKTDAIPGLIGRMLRLPSLTTLRAFDEFFKTVAAHTEVASLAYRDGRSRGMSGEALENHIDRVLNDFNNPLWQEGLDEALKTVFQDKSDRLTQLLLSTRSFLDDNPTTVPIGSFLLPFVKTPLQIFKVGLSMPIHPIIPIFRWVNRKRAGEEYTGKEKAMDSANALVSMALFVAAYSMLGDDDDDESRVTGAAPDQWEERMLGQRTAPAYSIKSSDGDWYTYGRIEPFATGFSAMVDGLRAQQRIMRDDVPDKWSQGMSIMFNNVFGQIEDKTFLRTVGDIAKMFRQRDQINAAKFAKDLFVTPMIPNLIRQTVGNTDPYIRNTTVREYEDKGTWESAMQSVGYAAYPDPSREGAPPMRYDLWGRPIKRPGDSAFARNFSPAQKVYDEDDVHKLDRLIVNFNDKVADGKFGESVEKYLPRSPEYRLKRGDESYILNDEEYARYSKESGERAARMLSRTRLNYDDPTQRDIDKIRDTLARSRKLVVDRILRERRKAAN